MKGSINPNDNMYYKLAFRDILAGLTHPTGDKNVAYALGFLHALTAMVEKPFAPHVEKAARAFLAGDRVTTENLVTNALLEIERGKELT